MSTDIPYSIGVCKESCKQCCYQLQFLIIYSNKYLQYLSPPRMFINWLENLLANRPNFFLLLLGENPSGPRRSADSFMDGKITHHNSFLP